MNFFVIILLWQRIPVFVYVVSRAVRQVHLPPCTRSVLKKWFKINAIQLVHLLVVWWSVNLQDARYNIKDKVSLVYERLNSLYELFWIFPLRAFLINHIFLFQIKTYEKTFVSQLISYLFYYVLISFVFCLCFDWLHYFLKIYIQRTNVMQLGRMFISNCNNTLHVWEDFCVHPQEHLETVVTASGVWHETGWSIE